MSFPQGQAAFAVEDGTCVRSVLTNTDSYPVDHNSMHRELNRSGTHSNDVLISKKILFF